MLSSTCSMFLSKLKEKEEDKNVPVVNSLHHQLVGKKEVCDYFLPCNNMLRRFGVMTKVEKLFNAAGINFLMEAVPSYASHLVY